MRLAAFFSCRPIIVASVLLLLTVPAWGSDRLDNRATLKGITAVKVVVEDMDADAERDGLAKSQLQTDVELRLRQAGINVAANTTGMGHLYVNVNTLKNSAGTLYAFSVRVEYLQMVLVTRDHGTTVVASTWGAEGLGTIGTGRLREVRSNVADYVDQFINAYLEQNPKR